MNNEISLEKLRRSDLLLRDDLEQRILISKSPVGATSFFRKHLDADAIFLFFEWNGNENKNEIEIANQFRFMQSMNRNRCRPAGAIRGRDLGKGIGGKQSVKQSVKQNEKQDEEKTEHEGDMLSKLGIEKEQETLREREYYSVLKFFIIEYKIRDSSSAFSMKEDSSS